MKRSLFSNSIKQTLLAVPAAALMLGAAQAQTTVGINFSGGSYGTYAYYNGALVTGYFTGFPVTATAFGVAASDWTLTGDPQLTPPTATGTPYPYYGPESGSIQAGPGGSLSVNWGGANTWGTHIGQNEMVMSAGGYMAPPAGNDEVTWGMMDNTGWSISLSGLNATFPNGYVIQGIAAGKVNASSQINITDGASYSGSLGFSSIYTVDGSPVGLQTVTPTLTSDAITISNPARPDATAFALSGFIVTDKPVISRGPVDSTFATGQTINLSATAIGVGTLSYQWRTNGVNISGATSSTYAKANATVSDGANFDVIVTGTYGMVTSAVATVTVAVPVAVTFDADPSTTGAQDGDGTWDLITTNWWDGSQDAVWNNLNPGKLGAGGTGNYTINLASSISTAGLTFNANYTITNASGQSITLTGPTGITANSNATLNVPIAGTDGLTKTGAGTLTLNKQCSYTGNTVVSAGTLALGVGGGGGTLQGSLTVNSNATALCNVNNALGYSGTFWVTNINLNFGTLATAVTTDNGWGLQVNMTGATMGTTVPGGYFAMGGSPVVNVTGTGIPSVISADMTVRDASPGGIVFNVSRGTAATDLNISGNLRSSGTGGITLNGNGITQLSGTNTYTGGTVVNAGTLTVSGQLTGDGAITLADNTTLNVTAAGNTPAISAATAGLTAGTGSGVNNTIGFAGLSSTNVAPITMGGYAVFYNPTDVKILSLTPVMGAYPLVQCAGNSGYFAAGNLTLPNGYTGTLSNDLAGTSGTLYLIVTGVPVVPVSITTDLPGTTDQRDAGATYTLSVGTYGTQPITYLWKHDGVPVGGNSPTLTLTGLTSAAAGGYSVTVTNALASVQSATNHLVVVQPPGYDALVLAASPVSYWPLDETSGSTAYDVYAYNNAAYSGTYVLNATNNPQTGISGAHFDGTNGIALTPYVPALNPAVFTAEAWVNPDQAPASGGLYCALSCGQFASTGRSGWLIYQSPTYWDLRTYCGQTTTTAAEAIGTTVPVIGAWTHLAVSWDGTNARLYVNGALEASAVSATDPAYLPGASGGFCAGARADKAFYFPGSVSGAAIYNRVLTPAEIQSHASYTAPTGPSLITVTRSGADLILTWTSGNLQAAPAVTGTYTNVPDAVSPYTVTPTEAQEFFRLVN